MSFEPDNEEHEKSIEELLEAILLEAKRTNWLISEVLGDTITADEAKDL